MVLLERIAGKGTQELNEDTFEGVRRSSTMEGIQDAGTNVVSVDVGVDNVALNGDLWSV